MNEKNYNRMIFNSTALYLISILFMFLVAISLRNGLLVFIVFLICSFIIVLKDKTFESLSPFFIALLMNNTLVEYEIGIFNNITLTGLIKLYFLIFFIISIIKYRRNKKMLIGYGFFVLWSIYFAFNAALNHTGIGSTLFSLFFPMIVCLVMQYIIMKNEKYKILLISGILSGFVFLCLCGYLELLVGKTFFYSIWTGAERYRFGVLRVGSTVSDPNFLSLIEVFTICFFSIPFIKRQIGKRLCNFLIFLGSLSIVLTFSRTGIISLIIVSVLMTSNKHKKYVVIWLPLLAMIAVPMISIILGSVDSVDVNSYISRNRVVEAAMTMWRNNPLLGNGNNSFYTVSQSYLGNQRSTMNEYVGELVNYGIIGLVFFVSYYGLLFNRCVGGFRKLLTNKNSIYYFAIIVSWLLMSYSLDTYYKILIWVLPSVVISVESLSREGNNNE